ncbi:MAG: hypothetical protein GY906_27460 [bacterium]|nr:hypothetical protein [bacterium]
MMKSHVFAIGLICLLAVPVAAERPPECENLEPSAGVVPAELADVCYNPVSADKVHAPTDTAFGAEAVTSALQSMTLNTPGTPTTIGDPGVAYWGCDFINNDTSSLLCYRDTNDFVSIDTSTAAVTVLGSSTPTNAETWSALAWDAAAGTLYASTTTCNVGSSLYTVDPADGTSTLVGAISNATCLVSIGIDTSGNLYGVDLVVDSLIAIDKGTGAGTVVGALGYDANFGQGMDFDHDDGTCYLFAFNGGAFVPELRTCNTATGATTLVGTIGTVLLQWGAGAVATAEVPVELVQFSVE